MKKSLPPLEPERLQLTPAELISLIAGLYAIPPELLTHASRRKSYFYSEVRGVAAWVLFYCVGTQLRVIMHSLGFAAHSAVLRLLRQTQDQSQVDPDFRTRLEAIVQTLKTKKPNL